MGPHGLTSRQFDALARLNEEHGFQFYDVGRQSIRFREHVGVIQAGDRTLEILPKAGRSSGDDRDRWHDALIDMLRECRLLKVRRSTQADLATRRRSLLDLYLESYVEEVRGLLREGLVRRYRRRRQNQPVLRGRLLFHSDLQRNLVHRERFFTEHQVFDLNHPLHHAIKRALHIVRLTAVRPDLRADAEELVDHLDGIDAPVLRPEHLDRIRFDRATERYRDAYKLARLIILSFCPDVRRGREDVLAILFDMNLLFEEYVYRLLRRVEGPDCPWTFRRQAGQTFWQGEHLSKLIRPDIVAEPRGRCNAPRVILDTKWKIPRDRKPDDADLKQMYAYNLQWGAAHSLLLYPELSDSSHVSGRFLPGGDPLASHQHGCSMGFLNLFGPSNRLDLEAGQGVVRMLEDLRGLPSQTR